MLSLAGMAPAFVAVLWPLGNASQKSPGLDEDQIRKATASLCVEHVLGWAYSDNLWTRGAEEGAAVGEEAFPDKGNVRAVCLGKEGSLRLLRPTLVRLPVQINGEDRLV
jgi:hypothetical protein